MEMTYIIYILDPDGTRLLIDNIIYGDMVHI